MIYDYGGFPVNNTLVQYPAPGSPELAARIFELLQTASIPAHIDYERGFDHGTYTVTQPMYPDASIPVVQLSVQKKFDPTDHLLVGRALAPLRDEGVLILGSGLSYHNLGLFGRSGAEPSQTFDQWLNKSLALAPQQRSHQLTQWSLAPAARIAHPREDHLVPLMVAVGAAESEAATAIYHEDRFLGGISVSSFRFG
jgi:aromatic ring-opening dioxygenase catalytic subunit (LigB family)